LIDLHGKFAALKLAKVADMYPGRVFFRAEFTSLPPVIFRGADFALMPSRDEPFGLVAVEFGKEGALGVGARVGGLGQMPGFWYTVESTSPQHLLQQFRKAILSALNSTAEDRARMRAWSAKQRFPVAEWVQRIDALHTEAIRIHTHEAERQAKRHPTALARHLGDLTRSGFFSRQSPSNPASVHEEDSSSLNSVNVGGEQQLASLSIPSSPSPTPLVSGRAGHASGDAIPIAESSALVDQDPFGDLPAPTPPFASAYSSHRNSMVSLQDVVGDRSDLKLQKVDATFNDSTGEYYSKFEGYLDDLNMENSQGALCISSFLKHSEKEWFGRYRNAKLGLQSPSSTVPPTPDNRSESIAEPAGGDTRSLPATDKNSPVVFIEDEFLLGADYRPPTGLKKYAF